jgi:hypothetical protein
VDLFTSSITFCGTAIARYMEQIAMNISTTILIPKITFAAVKYPDRSLLIPIRARIKATRSETLDGAYNQTNILKIRDKVDKTIPTIAIIFAHVLISDPQHPVPADMLGRKSYQSINKRIKF